MLDALRQTLQKLERPAALEDGVTAVPLGAARVDAVLGGGLFRGALHEVSAPGEAHLPPASGFVARVARAAAAPAMTGNVVWVAEDRSLAESGALYGPGLIDCGLAPERLVTVAAASRRDLLWAMEEALRCRSVRAVVGEIRAGALDGVAVRRLSLAAAESGALALLLRTAPPADASTAATRWLIGAAPSPSPAEEDEEGWPTRVAARLLRNRRGPLGCWILTWSDGDDAHAQPLAAAAGDRPHRAVA
jgi:protein ImuA